MLYRNRTCLRVVAERTDTERDAIQTLHGVLYLLLIYLLIYYIYI